LLRAPFSLEKITYNAAAGSVPYRSERHWRTRLSEDPTQPDRFGDDFSQSDAADGEPVFWPGGCRSGPSD